ncbi:MAG: T9SS type A sorting domain-containing protein [Candidatus Cloacimonetes bacterium]|nr:T9SS type A sorting domain-containing protein [Candidatus Cloacimonadota bacterium]
MNKKIYIILILLFLPFLKSFTIIIELQDIDSGLTSPTGNYRWLDLADNLYAEIYRDSFDYTQSNVSINYNYNAMTYFGILNAANLKPNFAYHVKLVGMPGINDESDLSNEMIGLCGRWWQEEWDGVQWTNGHNLNNKGDGSSPNPNDYVYFSLCDDPDITGTSPTGYRYKFTGYMPFDYFITDTLGNAILNFEVNSAFHVLWKITQRYHTSDDGPIKASTFDPDTTIIAYDIDYEESTVDIFGEWERLPVGEIFLPTGYYPCQFILTEESFHGSGGSFAGCWACAMGAEIEFLITPDPPGNALFFDYLNENYVNVSNPENIPAGNDFYTIEVWIKPNSMRNRGIIGWGDYTYSNKVNAMILTENGINNSWQYNDLIVNIGDLSNEWHYLAASFDGILRSVYLDGMLIGSDAPTGHIAELTNFRIGCTNINEYFDGLIDEVRIWGTNISQVTIQAWMNKNLDDSHPNWSDLKGYWKFNDGSPSQTAEDSSGNNNNGTLGSTPGVDSNDPNWVDSDAPLPVNLSTFTALFSNGTPILQWTTQSESNNQGWNVYRSETENLDESFQVNGQLIPGAGTTTEPTDYIFNDEYEVAETTTYYYWLESRDVTGQTQTHGPISLTIPNSEEENPDDPNTEQYGLFQNYPNPVSNSTTINFNLQGAADCKLNIYNIKGQLIKTLTKDNVVKDRFIWNGTNNYDDKVASGIYFYILKADNKNYIRKMILMD